MYPKYSDDQFDDNFTLLEERSVEYRTRKDKNLSKDLYFIKQTIPNTSGATALINAIANNLKNIEFKSKSILEEFINSTKDNTPEERAEALEKNAEFLESYKKCSKYSSEELSFEESPLHYATLVEHKNYIWRLDGNESHPFRVNITNKSNFLDNAAEYALEFLKRNPFMDTFAALSLTKF